MGFMKRLYTQIQEDLTTEDGETPTNNLIVEEFKNRLARDTDPKPEPAKPVDCETCQDTGEVHGEGCQECCDHSDRDSHCCLICGAEIDWSDFYDEDYGQDR